MTDDRSRIVRWAAGRARAAARSMIPDRAVSDPARALEEAFELWDLHPDLFDQPVDEVRQREVIQARAAWVRLRRTLGGRQA